MFNFFIAVVMILDCVEFTNASGPTNEILKKGTQLEEQGQIDEALKVYWVGFKNNSKDAELATAIAGVFGLKSDFEMAANLDPASGLGEYSLGALDESQGNDNPAEGHYEKCLRAAPENEGCLFNAAMTQARLAHLPEAKKLLERLLSKNPAARDAQEMLKKINADLRGHK